MKPPSPPQSSGILLCRPNLLQLLFIRAVALAFACLAFPVIASGQIENGEFDSLAGWTNFGSADISISADAYQSGNACKVTNRTQNWHGIAQSLHEDLEVGKDYHVSSYVKLVGSTGKSIQILIKQTDDRGTRYFKIGEVRANDSDWMLLQAGFNFQSNGTTTGLEFIFNAGELDDGDWEFDFLIDSVQIVENDWRAAADARIEQFRKRDVELTFSNQNGRAAGGLEVEIQQINHDFGFGSTMNHQIAYNTIYQDFFKQNFSRATVEFLTQWRATELVRDVEDYTYTDMAIEFAQANGIKTKGHALAYPLADYLPDWLLTLPAAEVQDQLDERIASIAARYDGKLTGWDVSNEMLEKDWLAETLGESYRAWMFQKARETSPNAVLSVNEYGMEKSTLKTRRYRELIEGLIADGADVGEIGLQSHYFWGNVSPKGIDIALTELGNLGINFYFTEFDVTNVDVSERAKALETFYRYAFSRPEANGITMWGFWAGSHWLGADASLVDLDWTINEAGQTYFELMDEWTTQLEENSGSGQPLPFRGFHGDYLVTTYDSIRSVTNYHLMGLKAGTGVLSQELQVNSVDGILNIYGTDGDDTFQFDLKNPDKVVINGEVILITLPVTPTQIVFVGGAGNDKLEIVSKQANQHFVFSGQRLSVLNDQAIRFDGVESVEAIARTLGSTVTFYDSAGDDFFTTYFTFSEMKTPDTEIKAKNFRFVFARSTKGGDDSALMFGSPDLSDRLYSDSNVLSIRTGSRNRRAIGFANNLTYSVGGNDSAYINLTASSNSLEVSPSRFFHQTEGRSLELFDFSRVTINGAPNNSDSVSFSGDDSNETLRIYEDLISFYGSGFRTTVNGINQSTYNSPSDGSDRVVVYDTSGDDSLTVSETAATYSSSVGSHTLTGLDSIRANSTNGGTDTATITGSAPSTVLVGDWQD